MFIKNILITISTERTFQNLVRFVEKWKFDIIVKARKKKFRGFRELCSLAHILNEIIITILLAGTYSLLHISENSRPPLCRIGESTKSQLINKKNALFRGHVT